MPVYNSIVVLGPTASGKTRLACQLAAQLNGEIISADSRQVYKRLNTGTGKDLEEYEVNGKKIRYHLIDVIDPSEQFYLHQFIGGLRTAFDAIRTAGRLPIICGGTGLYLDALRKDFSLTQIAEDPELREKMELRSKEDLLEQLKNYPEEITKHVDLHSKKRIIRGIEVAEHFLKTGTMPGRQDLPYTPYYIGIKTDTENRKKLIADRLKKRIGAGLIEETQGLLDSGLTQERLLFFGLEYKFTALYLQGVINKEELTEQLQTAIFQFAKRQMTWFRKMEKEGVLIHWIEKDSSLSELVIELNQVLIN